MVHPAERMFRVGTVLSLSLAILYRNAIPFLLVTSFLLSPQLVYELWAYETSGYSDWQPGVTTLGGMAAWIVLAGLAEAALVYGTVQNLRGRPASFDLTTRRGLASIFSVFGVILVSRALIMLGFFLFVLPGIALMIIYWVAIPAALVERPGIRASLDRSRNLTDSYRLHIFGVVLIVMVLGAAVSLAAALGLEAGAVMGFGLRAHLIADFLVNVLRTAFYGVASAVSYHLLRSVKEGTDIEEIAKVFD